MALDWSTVFDEAISAAESASKPMAKEVRAYLDQISQNGKAAFDDLARALAAGEIDRNTFLAEMSAEEKILEAEMAALKVMSKAAVQRAANAFIASIDSAVKTAVKAALVL